MKSEQAAELFSQPLTSGFTRTVMGIGAGSVIHPDITDNPATNRAIGMAGGGLVGHYIAQMESGAKKEKLQEAAHIISDPRLTEKQIKNKYLTKGQDYMMGTFGGAATAALMTKVLGNKSVAAAATNKALQRNLAAGALVGMLFGHLKSKERERKLEHFIRAVRGKNEKTGGIIEDVVKPLARAHDVAFTYYAPIVGKKMTEEQLKEMAQKEPQAIQRAVQIAKQKLQEKKASVANSVLNTIGKVKPWQAGAALGGYSALTAPEEFRLERGLRGALIGFGGMSGIRQGIKGLSKMKDLQNRIKALEGSTAFADKRAVGKLQKRLARKYPMDPELVSSDALRKSLIYGALGAGAGKMVGESPVARKVLPLVNEPFGYNEF